MRCGRASCVRVRHIGTPTAAQRQHWHGGGLNGQRHRGESVSESVSVESHNAQRRQCDCYIHMACVTILTQATLNARDSKENYITNFNKKSVQP